LKDYYQVLGVRRGAPVAEIRRAYRILVQQLHPDINPDPAAHERIKEVNEAYDVLGDAVKKQEYDYRFDNPYSVSSAPPEPVHRDPAYRRRSYRPVQVDPQRELMQRYIYLAKKIAWIGCIVCAVLTVDFIIPHRVTHEVVADFRSSGSRRASRNYVITKSNRYLKISDRDWRFFQVDQNIEVVESGLFSILIKIRIPELNRSVTNLSTIYGNYIFVPILLFVLSVMHFAIKGTLEFKFNLGIVTFFVLIFAIILFLK
jgi:hypothetical protein